MRGVHRCTAAVGSVRTTPERAGGRRQPDGRSSGGESYIENMVGASSKGFLLAVVLLAGQTAFAEKGPRNIVLIILDDLGVDRVGAYGQATAAPTPNLDALAARGVRFENFWGSPHCSPFRASALTGLPVRGHFISGPIDMGSERRALGLDPGLDTLPKRLARHGYRSEAIGKWHLAGEPNFTARHPLLAGFDHHAGTLGNPGRPHSYESFEKCVDGGCEVVTGSYLTTDTTDDVIRALDGPEPFFLWVGYNAAHRPFHVPPASLHGFDGLECPDDGPVRCHKALVEALDTELGRVFDAIDWSDTTVIVVADNGTPRNALDSRSASGGKGSVYETGIQVPLIVRGAAVAPDAVGKVAPGLAQVEDLFATVLDLAGESYESDHARSFAPLLRDPEADSNRPWQYAERYTPNGPGPGSDSDRRHYVAAATERYKVVVRRNKQLAGEPELYDRRGSGEARALALDGLTTEQTEALSLLRGVVDQHGSMAPLVREKSLPQSSWIIAIVVLGTALLIWQRRRRG